MSSRIPFRILLVALATIGILTGTMYGNASAATTVQPAGHKCKNTTSCELGSYNCSVNCANGHCACTIS